MSTTAGGVDPHKNTGPETTEPEENTTETTPAAAPVAAKAAAKADADTTTPATDTAVEVTETAAPSDTPLPITDDAPTTPEMPVAPDFSETADPSPTAEPVAPTPSEATEPAQATGPVETEQPAAVAEPADAPGSETPESVAPAAAPAIETPTSPDVAAETPVPPAGPDYAAPAPLTPPTDAAAAGVATAAALPIAATLPVTQTSTNAFDALKYGFSGFGRNWLPFVALTVLGLAASFVVGFLTGDITATANLNGDNYETTVDRPLGVMMLGQVIQFVVSVALTAATFNGAHQVCEGKKVSLGSMFSDIPWVATTLSIVVTSLIMTFGIVFTLGLGVFVLPVFLVFVMPAVINRDENAFSSIARSFSLVLSNAGASFGVAYLTFAVIIVGLIACVFPGLLVCIPAAHIAITYLYRAVTGLPVTPIN